MPEATATTFNRIVQLVAELTRQERRGRASTVDELAQGFGVTNRQILRDVRLLTEASDDPENTWISSLTAYQTGDRVGVAGMGPYRRPIRFTSEEMLALQVALATEDEPPLRAVRELGSVAAREDDRPDPATLFHASSCKGDQAAIVDLARHAAVEQRRLQLSYVGAGDDHAIDRVVHVHQVISSEGEFYLIAWCEHAGEWRRFRCDRVLEARLLDDRFERRTDVPDIDTHSDLFSAAADEIDEVRVRFSPTIARWIRERYPEAEPLDDGGTVVTFRTTSPDWLVKAVLQYGPEAEVLEPRVYREAVRRAVAATSPGEHQ